MICPRCADEHIEVMATSPVKDVWTVYQCQHCLYTWRNTEPLRRTSRALSRSVSHDAERYRQCSAGAYHSAAAVKKPGSEVKAKRQPQGCRF